MYVCILWLCVCNVKKNHYYWVSHCIMQPSTTVVSTDCYQSWLLGVTLHHATLHCCCVHRLLPIMITGCHTASCNLALLLCPQTGLGDSDYMAVVLQLLMPLAHEVSAILIVLPVAKLRWSGQHVLEWPLSVDLSAQPEVLSRVRHLAFCSQTFFMMGGWRGGYSFLGFFGVAFSDAGHPTATVQLARLFLYYRVL